MQAFSIVQGIVAPLHAANIDTDVIMPKQFLKGIDRRGLERGLFHELRFDSAGQERPEFILNQPSWRNARFLVVGDNFGCGSSREHAVWGLMQYGVRALFGTSFAGIFSDNCARNGLLTITLKQEELSCIMQLADQAGLNVVTVDLQLQTISGPDFKLSFAIDPMRKTALLQGLDGIGQTLAWRDQIQAFQDKHFKDNPWFR